MTLRHLRIFVTVCETGSTTAASEKLYIAQPSISVAIGELEQYYGIHLFDRIGRRLQVTDAGLRFLEYATHIVGLFDEMEREVKNFDATGIIRIGASITIGNYLLPQYAAQFSREHPQMQIRATIQNSDDVQQYVEKNLVDLALIEGPVSHESLKAIPFYQDKLVFFCAPGHPFAGQIIPIEQLASQPLILREPGSAGRDIFDGIMAAHNQPVEPAWQSVSSQAIVRAVQAGMGISVLPYLLIQESLQQQKIRIFQVEGISLSRTLHIIYHRHKFLTPSAKDFIRICQELSIQLPPAAMPHIHPVPHM